MNYLLGLVSVSKPLAAIRTLILPDISSDLGMKGAKHLHSCVTVWALLNASIKLIRLPMEIIHAFFQIPDEKPIVQDHLPIAPRPGPDQSRKRKADDPFIPLRHKFKEIHRIPLICGGLADPAGRGPRILIVSRSLEINMNCGFSEAPWTETEER